MVIIDWFSEECLWEKMFKYGGSVLFDSELLVIFLCIGIKGKSVVELVWDLFICFDGLCGVMDVIVD